MAAAQPITVSSLKGLAPELQGCCDDIIQAMNQATGPTLNLASKSRYAETSLRSQLWKDVFDETPQGKWNPSKPVPPHDAKPAPKHRDLRVRVGVFVEDLPRSTSFRRQTAKQQRVPGVAQSRSAGQPAYLQARPHRNGKDIDWFWCDSHGKGADPKFIDITGTMSSVQALAAWKHDEVVILSAQDNNREQVVYWMRCRLQRTLGSCSGQRVMNPEAADFMKLQKPVLLVPLIQSSQKSPPDLKAMFPHEPESRNEAAHNRQ